MQNAFQQTINNSVTFEGIGLHSGKSCKLKLIPCEPGQGIIFKRTDLINNNIVKAKFQNVSSAKLCTTLENNHGVKVSTVEHLLAAFYITGVDNVIVEIDSPEVPIMDGSSRDFMNIINNSGIKTQNVKRKYLKILDKVELEDNGRLISIAPHDSDFEVEFQLNYKNKIIGNQKNTVNFSKEDLEDVYSSRTFCLFEDIEKIKKIGLAKGGSLDNAIVVDEEKVINENGLRNEKEFVNHKILDLAGDFLLSGYRIIGKVECYQGGHQLSNIFLNKLLELKSCYTEITFNNIGAAKKPKSNQNIRLAAIA
jgi:UDP-3-O-[3-hydroxymyristoyl] N-acetylglucosamine deacetylase